MFQFLRRKVQTLEFSDHQQASIDSYAQKYTSLRAEPEQIVDLDFGGYTLLKPLVVKRDGKLHDTKGGYKIPYVAKHDDNYRIVKILAPNSERPFPQEGMALWNLSMLESLVLRYDSVDKFVSCMTQVFHRALAHDNLQVPQYSQANGLWYTVEDVAWSDGYHFANGLYFDLNSETSILDAIPIHGCNIATRALAFIPFLLSALGHLHNNRVVHGDIKPSNILLYSVDNKIIPRLADFDVLILEEELEGVSQYLRHSPPHGHTTMSKSLLAGLPTRCSTMGPKTALDDVVGMADSILYLVTKTDRWQEFDLPQSSALRNALKRRHLRQGHDAILERVWVGLREHKVNSTLANFLYRAIAEKIPNACPYETLKPYQFKERVVHEEKVASNRDLWYRLKNMGGLSSAVEGFMGLTALVAVGAVGLYLLGGGIR